MYEILEMFKGYWGWRELDGGVGEGVMVEGDGVLSSGNGGVVVVCLCMR